MAAWRRAIELSLGTADVVMLRSMAQSRTEPASRVERARILLGYWKDPSFFAVGQALGLHHQTVQRCVERAVVEGPMAALDDRPRPGREPSSDDTVIDAAPQAGYNGSRANPSAGVHDHYRLSLRNEPPRVSRYRCQDCGIDFFKVGC